MGQNISHLSIPDDLVLLLLDAPNLAPTSFRAAIKANRRMRMIGKRLLHQRIVQLLGKKFIPRGMIQSFLVMLKDTDSLIGGSVAMAILFPQVFINYPEQPPRDLNVFIPLGSMTTWLHFLENGREDEVAGTGEGRFVAAAIQNPLSDCFNRVYTGTVDDTHDVITLCEAKDEYPLVGILRSKFTSQMNFISPTHVYSIYPALTARNRTISVFPTPSPADGSIENRGFVVHNPEEWGDTMACGPYCRALRRCTWQGTGSGIGFLPWVVDNVEETLLQNVFVEFWLGGTCLNASCPYYFRNDFTYSEEYYSSV